MSISVNPADDSRTSLVVDLHSSIAVVEIVEDVNNLCMRWNTRVGAKTRTQQNLNQ